MTPILYRLHYSIAGGHVHLRVYAGLGTGSLGKCGDLTLRIEEFKFLRDGIERTIGAERGIGHYVEFVPGIIDHDAGDDEIDMDIGNDIAPELIDATLDSMLADEFRSDRT